MNNIKIIFVDLDGTLRDSNGIISENAIHYIEKLKSIGISVVFTTGRSISYTVKLANTSNPSPYLITSNGGEIYNLINKELLYCNHINEDDIKYLDKIIKDNNLIFVANTKDFRYSNKIGTDRVVIDSLLDITVPISQVVIQSEDLEKMKEIKNDINNKESLRIANEPKMPRNKPYTFFDITNSDVSKGNAATQLCDYLHIPLDNTMAIGNSKNDISMFDVCKYKVAVDNADIELKEKANMFTKSNDEDGVSLVLSKIYKENKE